MRWIVTVKPAEPGADGPHLVSDHPAVLQAVLKAITRQYAPEDVRHRQALRLVPEHDGGGLGA